MQADVLSLYFMAFFDSHSGLLSDVTGKEGRLSICSFLSFFFYCDPHGVSNRVLIPIWFCCPPLGDCGRRGVIVTAVAPGSCFVFSVYKKVLGCFYLSVTTVLVCLQASANVCSLN